MGDYSRRRDTDDDMTPPGAMDTHATTWREEYTNGAYWQKNPNWHVEDSGWKAKQILRIIRKNGLTPATICEVGCGAGEVLRQLQNHMDPQCRFWGYEVSPQAFELCRPRANERLHFRLKDIRQERETFFDVILLIDVIEHLEDYFAFLRDIKPKADYKVLHIPLDASILNVWRVSPLLRLRASVGHIHYFTRETALAVMSDVGYEVIDSWYTLGSIELPVKSFTARIAKPIRTLLFSTHQDFAARLMGGFSLMVLAR
jgi:hypothetical protein